MKKSLLLLLFPFLGNAQELSPELLENLDFRNIGPAGMSGRVTAIAARPENPEVIYAGTASGGLWRSDNGGVSWKPLFDEQPVSSIGAVALHQTHTDHVWVGTGEGNPRNSHTSGGGVFRSPDRGVTWLPLGLSETRNIHRILLHPTNPDIAYVAALGPAWGDSEHRGLYKTADGGKSWSKVLKGNLSTGCADVVMDPNNPNKLIAALWDFRREPWFFRSGGEGSGLFVSYDAGETWRQLTSKEGLPEGELGRIGLAISPSDPLWVYALVENKKKNALYRSEDGGAHWKRISENENIGNRPFYYSDLFVSSKDKRTVYSSWTLLTRSMDGGKSWEVIGPYHKIHPDHHSFFVHPHDPDYLIEGNDGGLNISRDGGTTWRFVENLPLAQFYHINVDLETPYNIYGGMQDNGSWFGPAYVWSNGGITNSYWTELYFGDGFDVLPDPTDNRYVYAMSQEGYVARVDKQTGYSPLIRPVHPDGLKLRFNWNAPIAADPFRKEAIYFGSQFVHRSEDQGRSWTIISPDLTTNNPEKQKQLESGGLTYDVTGAENHTTLLCIEPSPHEQGVIYTGSDDGKLHLTRNGGQDWTDLSSLLKDVRPGAWIPQIRVSPHEKDVAYVIVNDYRRNDWKPYAYKISGYGKKAERIAGPDQVSGHCLSIVQDPVEPGLFFLGTEQGLWYSLNGAKTWTRWPGKQFPAVPVRDLAIHPLEGDLIVATFGRAAWILDDLVPLRTLAAQPELLKKSLVTFPVPVAYNAAYDQPPGKRFAADAEFSGENRSYGARISYFSALPEDSLKDKKIRIVVKNDRGNVVRTEEHGAKPGLNRFTWDLDYKGPFYPSRDDRKEDADEPSGSAALPGTYRIVLELDKNRDSTAVEVRPDPRLKFTPEDHRLIGQARERLDSLTQVLEDAAASLRNVRRSIGLMDQRLKYTEDTTGFASLRKEIKEVENSLKKADNILFPKPDQKGYYSEPNTLTSKLDDARYFLGGSYHAPNQSALRLLDQLEQAMDKDLPVINRFLEETWQPFVEKWNTRGIPLVWP